MELGRPRRDLHEVKKVYDDTFVTASNSHHSMEPRTRWLTGRTVSASCTAPRRASRSSCRRSRDSSASSRRMSSTSPSSAAAASARKAARIPTMAIPALMSKKINRPVMMRVSRFEEYAIGSARNGFIGRMKLGFGEDGKLLAADMYIVQEGGAHNGLLGLPQRCGSRSRSCTSRSDALARRARLLQHADANGAARARLQPDGLRLEPLIDSAARELGIDRLADAQAQRAGAGRHGRPEETPASQRYVKDALAKGAERFNWAERIKRERPAERLEGHGYRHRAGVSPRRLREFDGLVPHHAGRAACTSIRASAISARSRTQARRASPPKC